VRVTKEHLVETLREIAALIEQDDSMEGSLAYEAVEFGLYKVSGCYRFGNREGQGGMCLIGSSEDEVG
jgi:hypothetical protein